MAADHDHCYRATTRWVGSTAVGYDGYDRRHQGSSPPAAELALSADPAFRGDASALNPEELLVLAASSCQLLSFLAVAARARVDVRAYEDVAEGVMPAGVRPLHITRIVLRPRITAGPGPSVERLRHLSVVAHRECYVANSLACEVVVEPTFVIAGAPLAD